MASAHQIRDLITETTTGTARPRVPREVRDEVCRYAVRRRHAATLEWKGSSAKRGKLLPLPVAAIAQVREIIRSPFSRKSCM